MLREHKFITLFSISLVFSFLPTISAVAQIIPGAERLDSYINMLINKDIAVVTNHTGVVCQTHLVDTLVSLNIRVKKIFCPEHGFRGIADAGQMIDNTIDPKTGVPVVSLYGAKKKPSEGDLSNIDLILFDLQDVGVRFYTYISTLHYVMEAAAENFKPVIVLDRPNPNSFYIDGPVLDSSCRSFVGLHPIPVVYGMTIGELGKMINGEGWLKGKSRCALTVIECLNYTHDMRYSLPVAPSPNLPNMEAVYLYPSLGFFEGTVVSVGRGTQYPFQLFGHPNLIDFPFVFKPEPMQGATAPKFNGVKCYGEDLRKTMIAKGESSEISLIFISRAYEFLKLPNFFNSYFRLLAGNIILQQQLEDGMDIRQIRETWQHEIEKFKLKRSAYLIYQ